jgi:uncharacterized protein (TIGR00251 family)
MHLYSYDDTNKRLILAIKVKAGSKVDAIHKFINIHNRQYLKIFVKALPRDGKANKAIISFLAKEWHINQDDLEIIIGQKNNLKILALKNLDPAYLNLILNNYIS